MQSPKTDSINELTSTSLVLETRLKDLNKARQMINNIKSLEEFMNFKLKFSQIFFDLDQEIRETLQNIKNAQLQNQEISNEKEFIYMKINNLENKLLNNESFISELKLNNKELVNQINFQQGKIISDENLILSLKAQLRKYEEAIEPKQEKMNGLLNKNINIGNNLNDYKNNTKFISLEPTSGKYNLDSINKENSDLIKSNKTITIRLNRDKEDNSNLIETNENFSNPNFNYNSPMSLNEKYENNSNVEYNNADQGTIDREDRFFPQINPNELEKKDSIEVEKKSYMSLKSQRQNSKRMLDNYLKENLYEFRNDNNQKMQEKESEENTLQNVIKKNETKSHSKIPEIKIENNNATKNNHRFEMPKVNKLTYNNLNNFHDEKRKIEETAGILSEETSHNVNSLNNVMMSNSLKDYKSNINNNNNVNLDNNNYLKNNGNDVLMFSEHLQNKNNDKNDQQFYYTIDRHDNNIYKQNDNLTLEKENNRIKKKPDRIIKIVMKINTCPDTSDIVSQLFGEDILERIISPDAEEEMINDIEQIISEIDTLKLNNNNNQFIEDQKSLNEEENIKYPAIKKDYIQMNENNNQRNMNDFNLNAPLQVNLSYNNNKKNLYEYSKNMIEDQCNNNNKINNNYDEKNRNLTSNNSSNKRLEYNTIQNNTHHLNNLNFDSITKNSNDVNSENNYLKISGSKSNRNLNKSQSKVNLEEYKEERWENPNFESMLRNYKGKNTNTKIFKNYTKKASEFFDPTLQRGGISKLDYDNRKKRSKSNTRGYNENSILGKSAEKSVIDKSYIANKQHTNPIVNFRENYQEILGRREYEFNYD